MAQPRAGGSSAPLGKVLVVNIANAVVAFDKAFCARAAACLAHVLEAGWVPEKDELGEGYVLPEWEKLPVAGGFKVSRPGVRGKQHAATASEKLDQARMYARYVQWAEGCGISQEEFQRHLAIADALPQKKSWCSGLACMDACHKSHCAAACCAALPGGRLARGGREGAGGSWGPRLGSGRYGGAGAHSRLG